MAAPFAVHAVPTSARDPKTSSTLEPYQVSYLSMLLSSEILKFGGPFTLKSGRQSPYFFNAGLFCTGESIAAVASCYAERIKRSGVEFDVLFGPAYKGIPLAATVAMALQLQHGINVGFTYNRKEAKTHGEGGTLVGASMKGKRVLVLDDVMTAGTAINEAVAYIAAEKDAKLVGVCIALDRQERIKEDDTEGTVDMVSKRLGVPVLSVVGLDQIIAFLEARGGYEKEIESMKDYRARYGSVKG
ncbi:orotate phosphoribosyltransferase [Acaromyces ingoldii]|uniref:orotate phosphoribosyltransferase n=1 Tax=Acaromyces ingoldii TaxID=215250 RepID=A0A316YKI7_9BASI|nr:orotate phosphoribosyltransferase [Acaromyces ingoldii]PWN90070.1 orotate phosphoribosyltransferase [Acaromyces ingoldii]